MLPSGRPVPRQAIRNANRRALTVGVLWILLTAAIGMLYGIGLFSAAHLLIITTLFYVFDLVCVLVWCPFQALFLKNRCCTTCRIYNWDYLMLCTPLLPLTGPLTRWACILAAVLFVRWEITYHFRRERFFESSNQALQCSQCQEHLCRYKRQLKHKLHIHP